MAQLRQDYPQFLQLSTNILVTGPDRVESFQHYWQQEHFPFLGIPDPTHSILNLYGQEVRLLKLGRMPAVMLIDINGFLRYIHYGNSMADIPCNKEILDLIKQITPCQGCPVPHRD